MRQGTQLQTKVHNCVGAIYFEIMQKLLSVDHKKQSACDCKTYSRAQAILLYDHRDE